MAPKQNYNKANYQKNQTMVKTGPEPKNFAVTRTKTDGRIGSVTPPAYLKGGLTVDNNPKAGPSGGLGSKAAKHMSGAHEGGNQWAPRVAKARAMASAGRAAQHRTHTEPVNITTPRLKHVKPD
jgi:hypothetical protein